MTTRDARLVLEDGTVFEGRAFGHLAAAAGEVVFNTGMVGYPETLTDPSYYGQILTLTYPLVGNYGVPAYLEDEFGLPVGFESTRIQVTGLVVSEHSVRYSHHDATRSLDEWLREAGVPAISGVDTRALTKRLREKGTMLGKLESGERETAFFDPNATALVAAVSNAEVSRTSTPSSAAISRIDWRVIPSRTEFSGGVFRPPFLAMKIFSPEPSETFPPVSRKRASS